MSDQHVTVERFPRRPNVRAQRYVATCAIHPAWTYSNTVEAEVRRRAALHRQTHQEAKP